MKIIKPSVELMLPMSGAAMIKHIERCGRVCYHKEIPVVFDDIWDGGAD